MPIFFATDDWLVVATLKSSKNPLKCDHTVFHLEKLKDLTCAQEYAVTVSKRFGALDTLEDAEELRNTFKRDTLDAAKGCIGEWPRSRNGFASMKALESTEKSCAARFAGNHDQYRALSHRTRTLLRRDKERYVRVALRMSSVI